MTIVYIKQIISITAEGKTNWTPELGQPVDCGNALAGALVKAGKASYEVPTVEKVETKDVKPQRRQRRSKKAAE